LRSGQEEDESQEHQAQALAMFTGRLASETMARMAATPPTTPGRIAPAWTAR
jgi:hypothetical protein